jgi:outer membrane autotransporter protein
MKTLTKLLLGLGLMAGAAAPAFAADSYAPADSSAASGFYLRGDAGWSWFDGDGPDDDEGLFVLGGGVGYQFTDNLRTDLRLDSAGLGNDDAAFTTVLGNVYFDIPTDTIVTPYLGAGLGYGWAETNGNDEDGAAFAAMAGLEVNLTEELSADIGYRYRQILSEDIYDHQALVGLRYGF